MASWQLFCFNYYNGDLTAFILFYTCSSSAPELSDHGAVRRCSKLRFLLLLRPTPPEARDDENPGREITAISNRTLHPTTRT